MIPNRFHISNFACLLTLASGCGSTYGTGDIAITQGGSQDMTLAREIIYNGGIPTSGSFTAEGLFSTHDLPLLGADCEETLCPRAASAHIDPVNGAGNQMLVQLGFASNVDADTFVRPDLNLAVALDISGSMSGNKMSAAKTAMLALIDQLGSTDRLALITFNEHAEIVLESTVMDANGAQKARAIVEAQSANGSTDIEAGMREAYEQVDHAIAESDDPRSARIMLLTDAQPNVGHTDEASFQGMAHHYADKGIGISVFGLGLDLGAELANVISEVRGGSHHTLLSIEDIKTVFDTGFDYLVTPVAYDLEVAVETREGLTFDTAYGVPMDAPGTELDFGASTLFFSTQNGGMGIALGGQEGEALNDIPQPGELVDFTLRYEDARTGEIQTNALEVEWAGGNAHVLGEEGPPSADDLGVFKMAVLLDEFLALEAAAQTCDGTLGTQTALSRTVTARSRLSAMSVQLDDSLLADEFKLMTLLAENLQKEDVWCQ